MGAMFAARPGADELLLSLALELEREAPWGQRWPGLYVEAQDRA